MKRIRAGVKALISSIGVLSVAVAAWARDADVDREPIYSLSEQISNVRGSLIQSEIELRRLLGNLYLIRSRMRRIAQEKSNIEDKVAVRRSDISHLRRQIESLEGRIAEQRARLRGRLKTLYKFSGQGFVALMLSQSSTSELDRTIRFLRDLSEEDQKAIKSFARLLRTHRQRADLLKSELVQMSELERDLEKQDAALRTERGRKEELAQQVERVLRSDRSRYQRLATRRDQLRESARASEIDDEILDLLAPSFMDLRGRLEWPIEGRVIRRFGLLENVETRVRFNHKGILIAPTVPGGPVRSLAEGRVIRVGREPGHGMTVILDHGDHHYVVFARLGRLKVKEGDRVKAGQIVANVGRADDLDWGYDITSAGQAIDRPVEGLYLEIRHFAEAENPSHWLKRVEPINQVLSASVGLMSSDTEGKFNE